MMRAPWRRSALLVIPALVASILATPVTTAQDPSPAATAAPVCTLLTVDEVAAAFGVTSVEVSIAESFYCSFSGDVNLYLTVMPDSGLEQVRTENQDGAELTVGGRPAWFANGTLWVDAGGQVVTLATFGSALEDGDIQGTLATLAEAVLARIPAGPDPADVARLRALVPETIGDEPVLVQTFTGEMLLGLTDAGEAAVAELTAALAAHGISAADILIIAGDIEADQDAGILVVQFKGADAASLLLPFMGAFLPDAGTAAQTAVEVGGKQVTRLSTDPVIHAYATGDLGVYANGPDDFLAAFFSSLP